MDGDPDLGPTPSPVDPVAQMMAAVAQANAPTTTNTATPAASVVVDPDDASPQLPGQVVRNVKLPTGGDPVVATAMHIYKERALAGNSVLFADAERMAYEQHGKPYPGAQTPGAAPDVQFLPTTVPATVQSPELDAIEAQRDALLAEFEAAGSIFDNKDQARIQGELSKLAAREAAAMIRAENAAATTEQAAVSAYETAWEAAVGESAKMFGPAAQDQASPLYLKAIEIQHAAMADPAHTAHGLAQHGSSAGYFLAEAARLIGHQPVTAGSAATSSIPQVLSAHRTPLAALIGGGSAPPAAPRPAEDALAAVSRLSPEQLRMIPQAVRSHGQGTAIDVE
jgi:hypothetical protein